MMEDVRIYDFELNLLHIQHDITTTNWTINYNGIGTFEGHFPISTRIAAACTGRRYFIVTQGEKQAVGIGLNAANEFVIFGRTVNWLLSKRSVPAFKTSELTPRPRNAEAVARWAFGHGYTDNETAAARDPDFILGELAGLSDTPDYDFWRNTRNSLDSVVIDALEAAGAGHRLRIDFDRKKWIFEVITGRELPIVLSEDNRNAYDTEYNADILDMATAGWYEYTPEEAGTEEIPAESEWRYMETDDPQSGRYRFEKILSGTDESEAKQDLAKSRAVDTVQAKMKKYKYGIDYNLGDIVTAQYKRAGFALARRCRITGVNIWCGRNDSGEEPIMEDLENGNTI